jgi:toluene monooxygenase system ferredoxin subunit
MAFVKVCSVGDVGPRGMNSFYIMAEEVEVLIVRDSEGTLRAFDGVCPHEDYPLVEGRFDGTTITCAAHGWIINATTGQGVNPATCKISAFPLQVEGDDVLVDFDVTPN